MEATSVRPNPPRSEVRLWQPKNPTSVGTRYRKWIGKPVNIDGWFHSFMQIPAGDQLVYECRWWGLVREMDRQIPECELVHPPNPNEKRIE